MVAQLSQYGPNTTPAQIVGIRYLDIPATYNAIEKHRIWLSDKFYKHNKEWLKTSTDWVAYGA